MIGGRGPVPERFVQEILPQWLTAPQQTTSLGLGFKSGLEQGLGLGLGVGLLGQNISKI